MVTRTTISASIGIALLAVAILWVASLAGGSEDEPTAVRRVLGASPNPVAEGAADVGHAQHREVVLARPGSDEVSGESGSIAEPPEQHLDSLQRHALMNLDAFAGVMDTRVPARHSDVPPIRLLQNDRSVNTRGVELDELAAAQLSERLTPLQREWSALGGMADAERAAAYRAEVLAGRIEVRARPRERDDWESERAWVLEHAKTFGSGGYHYYQFASERGDQSCYLVVDRVRHPKLFEFERLQKEKKEEIERVARDFFASR